MDKFKYCKEICDVTPSECIFIKANRICTDADYIEAF